jgi:hypothetical protein
MTAKEKAKELITKYYKVFQKTDNCFGDCEEEFRKGNCTNSGHGCGIWKTLSKECALISLEEIKSTKLSLMKYFNKDRSEFEAIELDYLQEVKSEIISYENEK